ncbi:MAG: hypothetical protein LBS59_06790 [Puniceicoccales bacterium]|jgi:hypothetical protein|nr:hypothetical protein [Puniceicoccales bacterium]
MIVEDTPRQSIGLRLSMMLVLAIGSLFLPALPRGKKAAAEMEHLPRPAATPVPPVIPYAPPPPTEQLPVPTGILERLFSQNSTLSPAPTVQFDESKSRHRLF